jgi:hypothetical protein
MALPVVAMATMWVLGAGRAEAQQGTRPVAVIDATAGPTSDPEVTGLAAGIEGVLEHETDLGPVASERLPSLVGGIPDEDATAEDEARAALSRGRDALTQFDAKTAEAEATRGIDRTLGLAPDAARVLLIADLAFVRARARFDTDKTAAERDFALVHRLDPGRTLDPVKHPPDVIKLYAKASKPAATATLEVAAPAGATVWVDGVSQGAAPVSIEVEVGLHAVTVTGLRLVTRGTLVDVLPGGAQTTLEAEEASGTVIVHRLRAMLATAEDDATRADAVAEIVGEVGAIDAIVVGRGADGALETRTFHGGKNGSLGDAKPLDDRTPVDIVKPLRPPKVKVTPPPPHVLPPIPPKPWYRKRWVQLAIGSGVVASVVTTLVIAATQPVGTSQNQPGLGFETPDASP